MNDATTSITFTWSEYESLITGEPRKYAQWELDMEAERLADLERSSCSLAYRQSLRGRLHNLVSNLRRALSDWISPDGWDD